MPFFPSEFLNDFLTKKTQPDWKITPQQTSENKQTMIHHMKNNYNPVEKKNTCNISRLFLQDHDFPKDTCIDRFKFENLRSPNLSHIFKFLAWKNKTFNQEKTKTKQW